MTFDEDTFWLNQEQLGQLFDRDRTVVGRHIKNIFKEGELDESVVCADFAHTTEHGAIKGKTQSKKLYRRFSKERNLLIKQPALGIKTDLENIRGLIIGDHIIFYKLTDEPIIVHAV